MTIQTFAFSEVSPAAAGTAVSSQPVTNSNSNYPQGVAGDLSDFVGLGIWASLIGATGGTLDVSLEVSPDVGSSWYELVHFPQLANGAAAVYYSAPISLATATTTPVVVGKGTVTALSANKVVSGAWGDRMRVLMTAGSGTSVGAAVFIQIVGQRPRLREAGG
jgi:hypothetical protein